jgi:hypothetical protein
MSETEAPQWWTDYLMADKSAPVTQIVLDMYEMVDAGDAMSGTCATATQNTQSGSEKIARDGAKETLTEWRQARDVAGRIHTRDAETRGRIVPRICEALERTPANCRRYASSKKINVRSVSDPCLRLERSTSITATDLEGHEVSFAVDATTVSECLKIASDCLARRFPTWSAPRSLSFDTSGTTLKITVAGSRNWEKGMNWSWVKGALDRHLIA